MATKATKSKASSPAQGMAKLNKLGIEWYCTEIVSGKTVSAIAQSVGVSRRTLLRWLKDDDDRTKKSNEARLESAAAFADLAGAVLTKARNPFQLAKARELAHHYRWCSAKISPSEFGDRRELVGAGGAPLIPDPYEGMTEDQKAINGAQRIALILRKGVAAMGHDIATDE